jgi:hypothetical protein
MRARGAGNLPLAPLEPFTQPRRLADVRIVRPAATSCYEKWRNVVLVASPLGKFSSPVAHWLRCGASLSYLDPERRAGARRLSLPKALCVIHKARLAIGLAQDENCTTTIRLTARGAVVLMLWHLDALAAAWRGVAMGRSRNRPDNVGWQEAVARLARERTLAENCARLLKKHGSSAAIASGSLAYGEAKAEYDGIIAGLTVALARKAMPASLPDLETRLRTGLAKREAFCRCVASIVPAPRSGEKGVVEEIVGGAIGPLVDALKAIWLRVHGDNMLARKTIETQLSATIWADFQSITSGPSP